MTVVVSKETEYGEVVSAEPTFVHEPAPAGERWNCTWATYESASLAADVWRLIVPVTGEPGSLIVAVGAMSSTKKAAWCPYTRAETVDVARALPVAPAVTLIWSSVEPLIPVVPTSPRSFQLPGGVYVELLTLPKKARTMSSFAVVVRVPAVTEVVLFVLPTALKRSTGEVDFTP